PPMEAYQRRTGCDPASYFAVGDANRIIGRIGEYIAAGISKFVLRPLGADGSEVMVQTRRLIDAVLPEVATRWPKPSKGAPPGGTGRTCLASPRGLVSPRFVRGDRKGRSRQL